MHDLNMVELVALFGTVYFVISLIEWSMDKARKRGSKREVYYPEVVDDPIDLRREKKEFYYDT